MYVQAFTYDKMRAMKNVTTMTAESVNCTMFQGRHYPHLEAMRFRLLLLQSLVSVTSPAITQKQVLLLLLLLSQDVITFELRTMDPVCQVSMNSMILHGAGESHRCIDIWPQRSVHFGFCQFEAAELVGIESNAGLV